MSEEKFNRFVSSELQGNSYLHSETVYSIRWAQNEIAKLRSERDQLMAQQSAAVSVSSDDSVYCDVYTHIADTIEPHVGRFGSEGELPASVTDSFNIIFNFWVANKNKSPRITEQDAREIATDFDSWNCGQNYLCSYSEWYGKEGRALLNKLNNIEGGE